MKSVNIHDAKTNLSGRRPSMASPSTWTPKPTNGSEILSPPPMPFN